MEATHFCEVWKYYADGRTVCSYITGIGTLKENLAMTDFNFVCETIAVWRIKETDVPIEKRLGDRFLGGAGLVSPNYLDRAVKLAESIKRTYSTPNTIN
jgi:hypothetical protein